VRDEPQRPVLRPAAYGSGCTADLSEFKPMRFEIEPKAASLNMCLPGSLLVAVKAKAKAGGVPYHTRRNRPVLAFEKISLEPSF
jgi:hypothetical protein